MDGQNFNTGAQNNKQTNVLAIISLVAGILSIIGACCIPIVGIIAGIAGIILAILGNKQGKTGLGTAGLICSIVGLVLSVILIIAGAAILAAFGMSDYMY